jgi:hypothetical protein
MLSISSRIVLTLLAVSHAAASWRIAREVLITFTKHVLHVRVSNVMVKSPLTGGVPLVTSRKSYEGWKPAFVERYVLAMKPGDSGGGGQEAGVGVC